MQYNRVLLKLSGESLMGKKTYGIDEQMLMEYVEQVAEIVGMGVKVGIVIGGGNIFRGLQGTGRGFDRVKGDYMGMLATSINALALQSGFESIGLKATHLTAISMEPVGYRFHKSHCMQALEANHVVIFSFGTGNPYFTTDTAATLRAVEMEAEVVLKGTRVDGIYTADPEKDPTAVKYETIKFSEAISKNLKVMDTAAFAMCQENNLPILVFDMNTKGNLKKIILGQKIGTLVTN
jgi:uridylate kinase